MLHDRIDTIHHAGADVVQVRFDLADAELRALARSVMAVATTRYLERALDGDAVVELRELVALHDAALERAEDGYDGGTLVLGVARLGLAVGVLAEWLEGRRVATLLRTDELIDLPHVQTLLADLRELHVRSLRAALCGAVCSP
jgi:hypothetical protein